MQQLMFKLDQNPEGRGLRCDSDGLFLGREALLRRDDEGNFEAQPDAKLEKMFGQTYGNEKSWESRIRSVKLVASALNKGDMARAMMTAVLMRLPDSGSPVRTVDIGGVLAKAGYNPEEPRDERERWTNGGSADASVTPSSPHRDSRIQLADDARSEAAGDPVAEAVARAAAIERDSDTARSETKPVGSEHKNFWQALSHEAKSAFWAIGNAQAAESYASFADAQAQAKVIAHVLKAYADYRAQPWTDANGHPVQVFSLPIVSTGAPFFNPGLSPLSPNAPIMRPGRNADWIDPLISLGSLFAMGAGPAARLAGPAVELVTPATGVLDSADVATLSADFPESAESSFSISDWGAYPSDLSRPTGPFKLVNGDEYDMARAAANSANRALREADPATYAGKQIHEIQPVKFGGSPIDPQNKIALTPSEHAAATTWWNQLLRNLSRKGPK